MNFKNYGFPQQLIYFDGFCGPGIYYKNVLKKEYVDGSPIITV